MCVINCSQPAARGVSVTGAAGKLVAARQANAPRVTLATVAWERVADTALQTIQ